MAIFVPWSSRKQAMPFYDSRLDDGCVYCGTTIVDVSTEHVPSKILLDRPYPIDLPVVKACSQCNNSYSMDEEYLAVLIECVRVGSTAPEDMKREAIRSSLKSRPALGAMIRSLMREDLTGRLITSVDSARIERVLLKLAIGHLKYELGERYPADQFTVRFMPLLELSNESLEAFENPDAPSLWPEVGSRAMNAAAFGVFGEAVWWEVQEDRYRYHVSYQGLVGVRMVLSEYLAAEVVFEEPT